MYNFLKLNLKKGDVMEDKDVFIGLGNILINMLPLLIALLIGFLAGFFIGKGEGKNKIEMENLKRRLHHWKMTR